MQKDKVRETIWFEMKPYCYDGENCDEIKPRWHCYADGDKDSDYQHEPLILDAKIYPPGTKIVVSEPVCPNCDETRTVKVPTSKEPIFEDKCCCGFNWKEWILNRYS